MVNLQRIPRLQIGSKHQRREVDAQSGSDWEERIYPARSSLLQSHETQFPNVAFRGSPVSSRLDFSHFINSMDDPSFAYFSLIREYAFRSLQGYALQYEGLYRALVAQTLEHEKMSCISVIEFSNSRSRSKSFPGYDEFKDYLDNDIDSTKQRLIILEDLPVRTVCLLGSRLRIHPTIFAGQFSTEDSSTISDTITTFPSSNLKSTEDGLGYESDHESNEQNVRRYFSLSYPVIMPPVSAKQHPDPQICPSWLKPSSRLTDQSAYPNFIVERMLNTPSRNDRWDSRGAVSELESLVTYWAQTLDDGGWNAVLLVDPCLKDPSLLSLIDGAPRANLAREIRYPELEDHEKLDISPNPLEWHPSAAFTKFNLHDDILIHYSVAAMSPGRNPLAVTPFVRGFAISKWTAHLNHIRKSYAHTRSALISDSARLNAASSHEVTGLVIHTARWGADWKEWMFDSIARFITDLDLYRLNIETNMHALGIDLDDPKSYGFVGKRETQIWRYLRSSCLDLQGLFQGLANSYTQVVALREAQTSNAQAQSVRWLTILGTCFVPLSIVAGILSMGGEFLPGKSQFWVYFAVVIPLLLAIGAFLAGIIGWQRASQWWVSRRNKESRSQARMYHGKTSGKTV